MHACHICWNSYKVKINPLKESTARGSVRIADNLIFSDIKWNKALQSKLIWYYVKVSVQPSFFKKVNHDKNSNVESQSPVHIPLRALSVGTFQRLWIFQWCPLCMRRAADKEFIILVIHSKSKGSCGLEAITAIHVITVICFASLLLACYFFGALRFWWAHS